MITLTAISPDRVTQEWRWIEPLLMWSMQKVNRKEFDTLTVLRRLKANEATAYEVHGDDAAGVVILAVHGRYLQPEYVAGKIALPQPERLNFMRDLVGQFIAAARDQGCSEVRIYGRDGWARAFRSLGFTLSHHDGERMLIRKVADA